ncbi:MAG: DNA polymerase IV [Thaumarchaeota archaeon]|nr:DNA polymerase IV [Candidatus Calditenuaceae archaeon]MDW8186830.1 DNA polymerase IV [Nitrososphaerota archaeon]
MAERGGRLRVIACVDIDYFFAQAEELRRPELAGRPVVVCVFSGRDELSGAVASANYVARSFGVKAGMPIREAVRRLGEKEAVLLPVDRQYYLELSRRTFEALERFSGVMEVVSVDEVFIDLTEFAGGFDGAAEVGAELKRAVRESTGLRCSVGIGPNKLIAKVACDRSKPDGLMVVRPEDVERFLEGLPVTELPFVGRKVGGRLKEMGVEKVGDLTKVDPQVLTERFGRSLGTYLYLASRGRYDEPLSPRTERKQFSRIVTLKRDSADVEEILQQLLGPVEDLCSRLVGEGLAHKGVGAIGISTDLKVYSRSLTLPRPNRERAPVVRALRSLFAEMLSDVSGLRLRRAGVRLYELVRMRGQRTLTDFSTET